MTDNGGERHLSPHDEYEPRQQEPDSWFTPSGDRHRSQSQYQNLYEPGVDGAPAAEETPAAGETPYETGATGNFRTSFPDTGGYPGMSGTRPGMAEPYPSALDGLGTSPSEYGTGVSPVGEQHGPPSAAPYSDFASPAVSRPYTPSADPATGEIPTVSHEVGTGPDSQEAPSASGTGAGPDTVSPFGGDATSPAESGGTDSVYRIPDPGPQQPAPFGRAAQSGERYSDPLSPDNERQAAGDWDTYPAPGSHPGGDRGPGGDPLGGWDGKYTVPTAEGPQAYPTGQWYDSSAAGTQESYPYGGGAGDSTASGWGSAPAEPWVPSHGDYRSPASPPEFSTGENTAHSWAETGSGTTHSVDRYDDELSRDRYDDELSRPYSGGFVGNDPAEARWEQWSGPATGEDNVAGTDTAAGTGTDPGGGIGTGSGNTWAFSREDPQLPDSVREAGIRAEERRGAGTDTPAWSDPGGWSTEGGTTGFSPGAAPAEGAVPQDGGADPLAGDRGWSDGAQTPSYGPDPLGSSGWYGIGASAGAGTDTWYGAGAGQNQDPGVESGTASDPGTGTQAMPTVPQDEGTKPPVGGHSHPGEAPPGAQPQPGEAGYGPDDVRSDFPAEEEWNSDTFRESPPVGEDASVGEQGQSRSAPPPEGEFPDFDERATDSAAEVDPYPGYDNIDYWPETDPGALTTVWLGVLSLVPVIGVASAAVVLWLTAPKARASIAESDGELEGVKLVTAGVVLAWAGIALFAVEVVAALGAFLMG